MPELSAIDTMWLLFCSSLLLMMQAGFTCLESGLIRSKNSANVVMKNLIDLTIALLVYGSVGFGLMFVGGNAYIGSFYSIFTSDKQDLIVFFIFQSMFCATAITIVSGALAERMTFIGYALLALFISATVYPIVGHWVWGGSMMGITTDLEAKQGWLAQLGFYDYAGATVVHSVGGWVALAALIIVGPRYGRYDKGENGFAGSSLTITAIGSFLIWIGWFGFNGGSLLRFDASMPTIILNTLLGGTAGMLSALVFSYLRYKKALVIPMINGGLIGLIAVTSVTPYLLPIHAILLGLIAGPMVAPINDALNRFKIDDAVGAIPVHLCGGVYATFCAGFFVPLEQGSTRLDAIVIQGFGVAVIGLFVFISAYIGLRLINRVCPLRVSLEAERLGLNMTEHNSQSTGYDITSQLTERLESGDFFKKVRVNAESDAFEMAKRYNQMVDKLETMNVQKEEALEWAVYHANHDALTGLFNRYALNRKLKSLEVSETKEQVFIGLIDLDNFKSINDTYGHDVGDEALVFISKLIQNCLAEDDFLARAGGEEFCVIVEGSDEVAATEKFEKLRRYIDEHSLKGDDFEMHITISIGFAKSESGQKMSKSMKQADIALYASKHAGRNRCTAFDENYST